MTTPLKIDIWSDIACPFCYIGKQRFEEAVRTSGIDVEVEYHSFELSPDTPVDYAGTHAEKIAQKMSISVADAEQMEEQLAARGREAGLVFDHARMRPTNTLRAHEVLHLAKRHGAQRELKSRLLAAYFTEGRNIGRIDELVELATDVGLDGAEVERALESHAYADAVAADIEQARALGIRGVPFFVIDGRYAISGAQDSDTFARALTQVQSELDTVS